MKTFYAHKAQPVGASTPEAVTIIVKDEMPNDASEDRMALDARRIANALWESGGTLDRLCGELLRRQASRLLVARRWPMDWNQTEVDEWRVVAVDPRTGLREVNGPVDEASAKALLKVARRFDPEARLESRIRATDWVRFEEASE